IMDGEGQWARYRRTLELERSAGPGAHVALLAPEADAVELAYLDIGPPGFQRSRSDDPETVRQGLANGDFQRWSRGLTFQSTGVSIETADGWLLSAPKGLKGVRAALVQIEAADGAVDYGIGLKADAPTGPVTLSTQVHPAAVRRGGDWTLELTVQRHPGSGRGVARLGRVLLSDDPLGGPRAAVLGRDVLLAPDARRVRLSVDAGAWGAAGVDGRRAIDEQPAVFLVIEFQDRALDAVLTGAVLTQDAEPEAERDAFASFEDFNLMSQLARTAGLEGWARETVSVEGVSALAEAEPAAPPARWSNWAYPAVDIVVPVYNAEVHTLGCLKALVEVTDIPYRLIVVDDGSAPSTRRALDDFAIGRPWIEVIHNATNLGYTRAANVGLKAGRAPWVVLLNSDTVVTPGWLVGLLDIGLSDSAIGMVGPLSNAATWQSVPAVRDAHGQWAVNRIPGDLTLEAWSEAIRRSSQRAHPSVPLLNGFCTLMRRAALQAVNFLDEETFPVGYGEEVDLCIRVGKAGYRMHVADDVFVFHHKSSSFGKERRAVLSKQGGAAVRKKHRDVNLAGLEEQLATLVPLLQLRQDLKTKVLEDAQ
ncbi:MAG: glycosyltransferase family 2 protein, partial [Brevundimonas sp.]